MGIYTHKGSIHTSLSAIFFLETRLPNKQTRAFCGNVWIWLDYNLRVDNKYLPDK